MIGWSKHDLWYYGVSYRKGCDPSDLWTKYFTSSQQVKRSRKELGEPDVIEVRRTFPTEDAALKWESRVLQTLDVAGSVKWLNLTNMDGKFRAPPKFSEEHKRKISESNKGKHRPESARIASKAAALVNTGKKRPGHGKKMSSLWKSGHFDHLVKRGEDHPNWGGLKETTKEKLKESVKNRPKACCIQCHRSKDDSVYPGMWTCHIINHHSECNG